MIAKWLRLFYERRIAVPIGSDALMLDAGCGEKAHWRADVLVDRFTSSEHVKQRNTAGAVKAVAPLFEAPLESLPFRDKAFDFVYCSHALEHVVDPKAAVAELMRVGKSGYIEVPFVGIQKLYDQETHLWYCDLQDNLLSFTAKKQFTYDSDIDRFFHLGPLKPFAFFMNFYPEAAMIRLHWSDDAPIVAQVSGEPNLELMVPQVTAETPQSTGVWEILYRVLRLVFARKLRSQPVTFNSIVKPEFRKATDETLSPAIYHIEQ